MEVEAGAAGVGGEKNTTLGIFLEFVDDDLALFLRNGAIEADVGHVELGEDWLDEIEHGGPFAEEDDFALRLGIEIF